MEHLRIVEGHQNGREKNDSIIEASKVAQKSHDRVDLALVPSHDVCQL